MQGYGTQFFLTWKIFQQQQKKTLRVFLNQRYFNLNFRRITQSAQWLRYRVDDREIVVRSPPKYLSVLQNIPTLPEAQKSCSPIRNKGAFLGVKRQRGESDNSLPPVPRLRVLGALTTLPPHVVMPCTQTSVPLLMWEIKTSARLI